MRHLLGNGPSVPLRPGLQFFVKTVRKVLDIQGRHQFLQYSSILDPAAAKGQVALPRGASSRLGSISACDFDGRSFYCRTVPRTYSSRSFTSLTFTCLDRSAGCPKFVKLVSR